MPINSKLLPKKEAPRLSIITVTLNNKDGLARTLNSVRNQSMQEFEYVVIDGASTDGSREFLASNSGVIAKYISEPDKGIYDAMNKGIRMASGEYLLFLNAGDTFITNNSLLELFSFPWKGDFLYADVRIVDRFRSREKQYPPTISPLFLYIDTICHQTQVIRRDLFSKIGMYDIRTKIVADYDFLVKAFFTKNIIFQHVPYTLTNYNLFGISAHPSVQTYIQEARKAIQRNYFPSSVLGVLEECAPYLDELRAIQRSLSYKLFYRLEKLLYHSLLGRIARRLANLMIRIVRHK